MNLYFICFMVGMIVGHTICLCIFIFARKLKNKKEK